MIEYSMMLLWLVLLIVFIVVEILSLGLTSIWFAGGALVALITSAITDNVVIQVVLFVVVSVALLISTRPIAKKYFDGKKLQKTNVDAVVGKVGMVKETIDNLNSSGVVVIAGMDWTARAENDSEVIEAGAKVVVKAIAGVKVIVEKV